MCQKSPSQAPIFHPVNTSKLINLSPPVAEESRGSKLTEKNSQRLTKEGGRKKHIKGKKIFKKQNYAYTCTTLNSHLLPYNTRKPAIN
jgi:hypothetical protein